MTRKQASTVDESLRLSLRGLREGSKVTAERLAAEARAMGLGWSRSTVADIESARRRLSAGEMLALPLILSAATGKGVKLADLFSGDIALTESITLPPSELRHLFQGEPVTTGYESLAEREAREVLARYEAQRKGES